MVFNSLKGNAVGKNSRAAGALQGMLVLQRFPDDFPLGAPAGFLPTAFAAERSGIVRSFHLICPITASVLRRGCLPLNDHPVPLCGPVRPAAPDRDPARGSAPEKESGSASRNKGQIPKGGLKYNLGQGNLTFQTPVRGPCAFYTYVFIRTQYLYTIPGIGFIPFQAATFRPARIQFFLHLLFLADLPAGQNPILPTPSFPGGLPGQPESNSLYTLFLWQTFRPSGHLADTHIFFRNPFVFSLWK